MTEHPKTKGARWEFGWIPIILGSLYVVGFVVANIHSASIRLLRPDIFEARYIGAALLYIFFTGFPLLAAFQILNEGNEESEEGWGLKIVLWILAAVLLEVAIFSMVTATQDFKRDYAWVGLSNIGGYSLLIIGGVTLKSSGVLDAKWDQRNVKELTETVYGGLIAPILLIVGTTLWFGYAIYPYISPAFGGGAGWLASAQVSAEQGRSEPTVLDSILIMERGEEFHSILTCSAAETDEIMTSVLSVEIPNRRIEAVHLHRPLAVPMYRHAARDRLCSEVPTELEDSMDPAIEEDSTRVEVKKEDVSAPP